jgi:fumarate reductase subunit D
MKKIKLLCLTLLFVPAIASAATFSSAGSLSELVQSALSFIGNVVVPLLVTLALVVFFYRIVISIYKVGEDTKAVENGKTLLIWGVVALFVMVSVWGLVGFIGNTVGIKQVVPQLEGNPDRSAGTFSR